MISGQINPLFTTSSPGNSAAFTVPFTNGNTGHYCEDFVWGFALTGSPSLVLAKLQGSLDGANWFDVGDSPNAASVVNITGTPLAYIRATGWVAFRR